MKIALLDLVHTTRGTHSNTVPLGIGLLATYLKKNLSTSLEIRLFKEPDKALTAFETWTPDIVGITQYTWNSELNLHFANLLKQKNSACLVVAGGPNLDISVEKRKFFLKKNNYVDICVAYDGEVPLLEIVKRILGGESFSNLRAAPPAGTYSLDPHGSKYMEAPDPPPRLKSLDAFGPVYAEGVFDEFLDAGYHPFTQTHRGCPFSCAYCRTSDSYNSKMLFQSPEIFRQDMEYLGKRFAGRPEVILYIGNTNMSLFKEDFPIAQIIRETQDKYNWPKRFHFDTGKDPKKLLDMLTIIKFVPAPALQTLTPEVLKNINRKNLSLDDYVSFQREILRRIGENSMSELILCLPGETKQTFLDTVRKVINSGVQNIVIYTLMKLIGTPMDSEEFSKRFNYVLRYRIVPRQFSLIKGKKIFEIEEVIVGTKDMSIEDYMELRGLCFTISIFFGSAELIPLKKFLLEYNVDLAQWLFNVHEHLKDFPDIYSWYQDYLKETREELFVTREELFNFFNKQENYEDLFSGKKGDNLVRKYKHLVLCKSYPSYLNLATREAKKITGNLLGSAKADELVNTLATYLSTRDMRSVLSGDEIINGSREFYLKYDISQWLASGAEKTHLLEEFESPRNYIVRFSDGQKKILKNFNTHKDPTLSLQMLYRDGYTEDLWPKWQPREE